MHVSLEPGRARIPAESLDTATNSGYFWRDIERTEADWYRDAAQRLDTHLRDHRLVSSLNGQQTQFYDDIDNYDLLVLRVLGHRQPHPGPGRAAGFMVPGTMSSDQRAAALRQDLRTHQERLLGGQRMAPVSPVALLAPLIN